MPVPACGCMLREEVCLLLSVPACRCGLGGGACVLLAHARSVRLAVSTRQGPGGSDRSEGGGQGKSQRELQCDGGHAEEARRERARRERRALAGEIRSRDRAG
eukprot:952064-Rhodomonas_salina.1